LLGKSDSKNSPPLQYAGYSPGSNWLALHRIQQRSRRWFQPQVRSTGRNLMHQLRQNQTEAKQIADHRFMLGIPLFQEASPKNLPDSRRIIRTDTHQAQASKQFGLNTPHLSTGVSQKPRRVFSLSTHSLSPGNQGNKTHQ
jgi:hypothetical protein